MSLKSASNAITTTAYLIIESSYNNDESTGLRDGKEIQLTGHKSRKFYPENLRMAEYYDRDKDVLLVFLINNFEASAMEVARLYRNRWQIEVFFKWIKPQSNSFSPK